MPVDPRETQGRQMLGQKLDLCSDLLKAAGTTIEAFNAYTSYHKKLCDEVCSMGLVLQFDNSTQVYYLCSFSEV